MRNTQDVAEHFHYWSNFKGFSTEEKRLQNFACVKRFRNKGKRVTIKKRLLYRDKKIFTWRRKKDEIIFIALKLLMELGKDGELGVGEFVLLLHLPSENSNRPLVPSEGGSFIQGVAEHFAYVSSFEGFATEDKWLEETIT